MNGLDELLMPKSGPANESLNLRASQADPLASKLEATIVWPQSRHQFPPDFKANNVLKFT